MSRLFFAPPRTNGGYHGRGGTELPSFVARFGRRSLKLAAGRPADGAARNEDHFVNIQSTDGSNAPTYGLGQCLRRHCSAGLCDDDNPVVSAYLHCPERDDASASNTGQLPHCPFEIVRVVFASIDDDDVLDSAADKELAL
jgi:hypothetical protein